MIVELPGDLIRPVVHLDFRHALHLDFRGLTKDLPTTDAGFCDAAVDWSVLNSTQLECFPPYCVPLWHVFSLFSVFSVFSVFCEELSVCRCGVVRICTLLGG